MLQRRHNQGFTLLEILLVIVLLSLTAIVVVPTFPSASHDNAKLEAERFYQLIQLWNERSLISNQVLGVRVEQDNYQLLRLDDNAWTRVAKTNRIATKVTMPKDIKLSVDVTGMVDTEDQLFSRESLFDEMDFNQQQQQINPPQLVMMGNGEQIAFSVIFSDNNERLWQVSGSDIGAFELTNFNEGKE